MSSSPRVRASDLALLLLVISLPLLGAALAGRDLRAFFRFPPPLEIPSDYPKFSWLAAAAVVTALVLIVSPWFGSARRRSGHADPNQSGNKPPHFKRTRHNDDLECGGASPLSTTTSAKPRITPFPWWGWAALAWTLVWWAIAWQRWPELEGVRRFTFFPLWFGFIVTVNAYTYRRTGTCLMQRAPAVWLTLFGASACFWWGFEWFNRFVRNWHYLGVSDFGPVTYALHASLCFSTVLPAVTAVAEALGSHSSWTSRTAAGLRWPWLERPGTGVLLLVAGMAALLCAGALPRGFYFALWIAPLAMFLGKDICAGRQGLAREIAYGVWSRAATWMAAALLCGFFWELWNWQSWPKWIYTVPGVERWHIFEMPLLGYTGYLPFGLECLVVIERIKALCNRSATT